MEIIKPQELRIGNLIEYDGTVHGDPNGVKKLIKVDGELMKDLVDDMDSDECNWIDQFSYAPLTEERLLEFGFKKKESDYLIKNVLRFGIIHAYIRSNNEVEFELGQKSGFTLGMIKHIKYAHQIQNLFFSLVGEELEFNKGGAVTSK